MYCWNLESCDGYWCNSPEDTIEACLEAARESNLADYDGEYDNVYIGRVVPFDFTVDGAWLLDTIEEEAYDKCGDVGDDWSAYNYHKKDELKELDSELTAVVKKWMKKYGYYPNFYSIEETEVYEL